NPYGDDGTEGRSPIVVLTMLHTLILHRPRRAGPNRPRPAADVFQAFRRGARSCGRVASRATASRRNENSESATRLRPGDLLPGLGRDAARILRANSRTLARGSSGHRSGLSGL